MFIVVKDNVIVAVEDDQFETAADFGEWIDIGTPEVRPNVGYSYTDGAVVYPEVDEWAGIRSQRDYLLAQCDYVTLRAYSQGTAVPESWATYQQALRDITETYATPEEVVWPTKPE